MHALTKFWAIPFIILALSACSLFSQVNPPSGEISGGVTPSGSMPDTVTPPPVATATDTALPTLTSAPTEVPTPTTTLEPAAAPTITFDQQANAYRIRFAPNGTWVQFSDTFPAGTPKRYVLSAAQGQVMSISISQGPACTVEVNRKDGKPVGNSPGNSPFWRGVLTSTQDYIVTVVSQADSTCTLRIVINPPGKAIQNFGFFDSNYHVSISYTDEFAPTDVQIPWVTPKGTPLLTLVFIDSDFYAPITNLSESFLMLAASADPAIVSTCTQPSTQVAETVTGTVKISKYNFTRSEFSGAAAGNRYDQVAYRTVVNENCFEMILLIHSANIGNYPPGTVVEYDQAAVMSKFETVLNTFLVK